MGLLGVDIVLGDLSTSVRFASGVQEVDAGVFFYTATAPYLYVRSMTTTAICT